MVVVVVVVGCRPTVVSLAALPQWAEEDERTKKFEILMRQTQSKNSARNEWEEWVRVKNRMEVQLPPPLEEEGQTAAGAGQLAAELEFTGPFPFRYQGVGWPVPEGGQMYMQAGDISSPRILAHLLLRSCVLRRGVVRTELKCCWVGVM